MNIAQRRSNVTRSSAEATAASPGKTAPAPEKVQPKRAAKKRKVVESASEQSEEIYEIKSESKKTEAQSIGAKLDD